MRVLEHGRVSCEDTETQADEVMRSTYIKEQDIRAYVGTRLISIDEPLGVLYVSFKDKRRFSADELALIQILANYASTAIYRAELLDQRTAVTDIARDGLLPGEEKIHRSDEVEVPYGSRFGNDFEEVKTTKHIPVKLVGF